MSFRVPNGGACAVRRTDAFLVCAGIGDAPQKAKLSEGRLPKATAKPPARVHVRVFELLSQRDNQTRTLPETTYSSRSDAILV